MLNFLI